MTKKHKKERCREIIKQHIDGSLFQDDFINTLFMNHPNYIDKRGPGIIGFKVLQEPEYKTFCFHAVRSDNSIEKFSFLECISKSSILSDFKAAARKAVSEDIIKEKRNHSMICKICGQSNKDAAYHLDHHLIKFDKIVMAFIDQFKINIHNIEYIHNTYGVELPENIKQIFREYHNGIATYRILCKQCNLKGEDK